MSSVLFYRFVPEIDEPSLNKEDVNVGAVSKRKELFRGKTFIFLSAKQVFAFLLCCSLYYYICIPFTKNKHCVDNLIEIVGTFQFFFCLKMIILILS